MPTKIIEEARKHFFTHGFRGVTMDDLALELGMSKKTLYTHFSSKTELVARLAREKMEAVSAAMREVVNASSGDVVAVLRALLACLQQHTADIQPAFFRDLRRETPELFNHFLAARRENITTTFGRVLSNGRQSGVIRTDLPVPVLIEILITLADTIVNPAKLSELGLSIQEGVTAVISVFLQGALVPESRSLKTRSSL